MPTVALHKLAQRQPTKVGLRSSGRFYCTVERGSHTGGLEFTSYIRENKLRIGDNLRACVYSLSMLNFPLTLPTQFQNGSSVL